MRRLLRFLLLRPVMWLVSHFSSRPDRKRVMHALSALAAHIQGHPGIKGPVIPFVQKTGRFIIFSDQHKGTRNGADDFKEAEQNYLAALDYYNQERFCFINLGDSEELWENSIWKVKKENRFVFEAEKKFLDRDQYVKVFGNHDLYWDTSPWAYWHLKNIFGQRVKVYEGVILQTHISKQAVNSETAVLLTILLTHGHQGDGQSDGNWFSKFFVGNIWAPLQSLLRINPNTPANNNERKTLHNEMMYEWSSQQQNMLLVTGHTHQPVFASLTHLEKLYKDLLMAKQEQNDEKIKSIEQFIVQREKEFTAVSIDYMQMKPTYFNSGCCCFSDGDITGIEIADGCLRLIKWTNKEGQSVREKLEEKRLEELVEG